MSAQFIWFDLTADDPDRAREFYTGLFGWSAGAGAGSYPTWCSDRGQPWAGIVASGEAAAGRRVPYLAVENLDGATRWAVSLGATVVWEATEGPAGTAAAIADPSGSRLALFTPRTDRS